MLIKKLFLKWFKLPVWQKVIICLVLGIITGLTLGPHSAVFKPLGDAFINALHMVIVPVILSAVVCAVISVADFKEIRRVTFKAFGIYFCFLAVATLLAIAIGQMIKPGLGLSTLGALDSMHSSKNAIIEINNSTNSSLPGLGDIFANMIPRNPVAAFINENILQIVIFGILFGIAINLSGQKGQEVAALFRSMSEVSKNLTNIIMKFAPYGVFALISWTFGLFGLKALLPLLSFIVTLFIACATLVFIVYGGIIILYLKDSPFTFFRKIGPAMVFAMSTTSSGATLPVSIRCAEEELRVPPKIAKFLLPLGCNFNLSGLAIYLTIAVIFTANIYGITLTSTEYLLLISTVILTTMGTGAIPGSGIVVMSAVIATMGMPLGAIPLIAGIDRINDMIQTTTNVISDIFAAYLVSESEIAKSKAHVSYPIETEEEAVEENITQAVV